MQRPKATVLLLLGLSLPFLGKPVHIDDTNFLALARAASENPWQPHNARINWQGSTEMAFDVLSNPPGIAWWLAPIIDSPVWLLHLWMLPWLLIAAWGAWNLGQRFTNHPAAATVLICAAPIGLLATHAFTPDLPLLACALAGMAGLTKTAKIPMIHRWGWAVLLGCSALFRYSGIALIPMVTLWALMHRNHRAAAFLTLGAAFPTICLMLHDLFAYGQAHVTAMLGFQGTATEGRDFARKLIASVAMLGGAALLPILCWSRPRGAALGSAIGVALGIAGAQLSGQHDAAFWTTILFSWAGGASLGGGLFHRWTDIETRWLATWFLIGLIFLLTLRFTAARYWLPFFPALVLLSLQKAPTLLVQMASVVTVLLSLGLATDDHDLALTQQDLANGIQSLNEDRGRFAGHWGFQYHLQDSSWQVLEEDSPVPPGRMLAVSASSWPQAPADGCFELVQCIIASPLPFVPRVYAPTSGANFHAFMSAGFPGTVDSPCDITKGWDLSPTETYAPWTFSSAPQDVLTLWRSCETIKP